MTANAFLVGLLVVTSYFDSLLSSKCFQPLVLRNPPSENNNSCSHFSFDVRGVLMSEAILKKWTENEQDPSIRQLRGT